MRIWFELSFWTEMHTSIESVSGASYHKLPLFLQIYNDLSAFHTFPFLILVLYIILYNFPSFSILFHPFPPRFDEIWMGSGGLGRFTSSSDLSAKCFKDGTHPGHSAARPRGDVFSTTAEREREMVWHASKWLREAFASSIHYVLMILMWGSLACSQILGTSLLCANSYALQGCRLVSRCQQCQRKEFSQSKKWRILHSLIVRQRTRTKAFRWDCICNACILAGSSFCKASKHSTYQELERGSKRLDDWEALTLTLWLWPIGEVTF